MKFTKEMRRQLAWAMRVNRWYNPPRAEGVMPALTPGSVRAQGKLEAAGLLVYRDGRFYATQAAHDALVQENTK